MTSARMSGFGSEDYGRLSWWRSRVDAEDEPMLKPRPGSSSELKLEIGTLQGNFPYILEDSAYMTVSTVPGSWKNAEMPDECMQDIMHSCTTK